MSDRFRIIKGEALAVLRDMGSETVDCCVTSPPYWRMRDYGHPQQIGMEDDPSEFVGRLADVFDEILRVLKPTGTFWINIGDCYQRKGGGRSTGSDMGRRYLGTPSRKAQGCKDGDLIGIPWMLAFECRSRGWYLRGEQIWAKSNPTPDACDTRPSRSHEHVFLLTKRPSPDYYYDANAIRTPLEPKTLTTGESPRKTPEQPTDNVRSHRLPRVRRHSRDEDGNLLGAKLRSVWAMGSNPNRGSVEHHALMPKRLAHVCIASGCPPEGVVLDPFAGSGTTGLVALRLGRTFVGIDVVPRYVEMAEGALRDDAPLLSWSPTKEQEV